MKQKTDSTNNKYFANIIVSFSATIGITILILSTILYVNFESVASNEAHIYITDALDSISYTSQFMAESVVTLSGKLGQDESINKLFYSSNITDVMGGLKQLSSYCISMPYVNSIYLINTKEEKIYAASSGFSIKQLSTFQEFKDTDLLEYIVGTKNYVNNSPIFRQISMSSYGLETSELSKQSINVYTFVNRFNKQGEYIVINVDESWVMNQINSMGKMRLGSVFICDNNAEIVSSIANLSPFTVQEVQPILKRIIDTEDTYGSETTMIANTKYLISYVKNERLSWNLIRLVSYSNITNRIRVIKNNTIIIGVSILLGGLLTSFVLSRRLYQPVQSIVGELMLLKNERYKAKNALNRDYIRNMLLQENTVQKNGISKNLSVEETKEAKESKEKQFYLVLLQINKEQLHEDVNLIGDIELVRFAVMNIAKEIMDSVGCCDVGDLSNEIIAIICDATEQTLKPELIYNEIINIKNGIKQHLKLDVCCVFSGRTETFNSMHQMYLTCEQALKYRMILDNDEIISITNIEKREKAFGKYPSHLEKKLIENLKLGKGKETASILEEMLTEITIGSYSNFYNSFYRILISINTCLDELKSAGLLSQNIDYNQLTNKIVECGSKREILLKFIELFNLVELSRNEKKVNRDYELVEKVLMIISSEYSDLDLSPDSIGMRIGMSGSYLSKIFKGQMQISLTEHINDVRISRAVELITSTNKTFSQIAIEVGYGSNTYFSTAFKKAKGKTPGQFRKDEGFSAKL